MPILNHSDLLFRPHLQKVVLAFLRTLDLDVEIDEEP